MSDFKIGDRARVHTDTSRNGEKIYKNCKILDYKFNGNGAEYKIIVDNEPHLRWVYEHWLCQIAPAPKEVTWDE